LSPPRSRPASPPSLTAPLPSLLFHSPSPLSPRVYPPSLLFFFNDTATTEIYTLSLHDALPISAPTNCSGRRRGGWSGWPAKCCRSEEHTSELQSLTNLVCRLLLEKKKKERKAKHTSDAHTTNRQLADARLPSQATRARSIEMRT